MGAAVEAMQHGLDRVATVLIEHPELLSKSFDRSALAALVDVAEKMIDGAVGPIEGSRRIAQLRFGAGDEDNSVLMPFVGIDSEAGNLVVGDRSLWADAFLAEIDRGYEDYERRLRPTIADDCRALLSVFAPRLRFWTALDERPSSE